MSESSIDVDVRFCNTMPISFAIFSMAARVTAHAVDAFENLVSCQIIFHVPSVSFLWLR